MLRPSDDLRHALAGPLDRESFFLTVPLADEGLVVHVYGWVDRAGLAGRVVSLFADDDRRLLFDRADGVAMGGRDFDDWQVAGLRIRHGTPLETADFSYDDGRFAFDVRFEALHRAFPYSENRDGCPPCMADDRFEQAVRVRGWLRLPDRRVEVDTTGHRDRSWGRRDYSSMHHFKWISAQVGSAVALNGFQILAGGEQWVNGYVLKDGVLAPVASIRTEVEYDERFAPRSLRSTITDERGRTTIVGARRFAHLRWEAPPIVMDDVGCRVEVDGRPGTSHIGLAWTRPYLDAQLAARRR